MNINDEILNNLSTKELWELLNQVSRIYTQKVLKQSGEKEENIICQNCQYNGTEDEFLFGGHPGGRQIWVHICPKCNGWTKAKEDYLLRRKTRYQKIEETFKEQNELTTDQFLENLYNKKYTTIYAFVTDLHKVKTTEDEYDDFIKKIKEFESK